VKLPRLKIGDCLYASRRVNATNVPIGPITITAIDASSFFCQWPDGRPVGVSRRQLREYGEAYGDPPGTTYTLEPASPVVADSVDGYAGPVVVHGAMQ
jgi:hypothetical protein